jgi:endonuclease/exonuclease/phosphatase family metal-dependent hydrolase
MLSIGYPILILIHTAFMCYWLIRLKKVAYLSTLILIVTYLFSTPLFQTKSVFKALAKDNSFSVLSFNTQLSYYSGFQKSEVQKHQSDIRKFIEGQNVDIVCLQEARNGLLDNSKYLYSSQHAYNQIWTTYPILFSQKIETGIESTNKSAYADLLINRDTVRIYNLHLESLHLANEDYSLLKENGEIEESDNLTEKTQNIFKKIDQATAKRVQQVVAIKASINDCPYPSLICGDFNDVPQSYAYQQLSESKKDAFLESGKGYGASYQELIFPFRIDYLLIPDNWRAFNFKVLKEKLSDHQAIRCDVEIN